MQVAHWKRKCERLEHQAVAQVDAAAIEKDNERCARSHAQQAIAWVSPCLLTDPSAQNQVTPAAV